MVTTSLELPQDMRERIRAVAAAHCLTPSMLIRQYIELGLFSEQPERMLRMSRRIR
ncbi:hypothetical protein [Nocardia rhamnosiphila]